MEEQIQEQVVCWRCQEPLLETQPQTELPCHHFLHTACLINIVHYNFFNHCALCNTIFFEHEDEDAPNEVSEETRIQNLYNTDIKFKKAAKKLAKQKAISRRNRTKVVSLVKQKKGEIRNQLLLLKAQVEGLTNTKKQEVFDSQEYKDYIKSQRTYTALENRIRRDYTCSPRLLQRALQEKPGFKRFNPKSRWRDRSYYLFQRPWRFHIPL